MFAAAGVADLALSLAHRTAGFEGRGDLLVQLHTIRHDDEGPIARHGAQDLLGVEDHGETLAAALRLPEDTTASVAFRARLQTGGDGIVHAEELMVLPHDLHQPGLVLGEENKVLHQIEQARLVAGAADHHLQGHPARFVLAGDALPLKEPLPVRRQRSHATVRAVAGNHERVSPEERRDVRLVAGQVVREGLLRGHARLLEFHHHQRQPVDEADQIRPPQVERPLDGHLAHQKEIIRLRVLPVDHPHPLDSGSAFSPSPRGRGLG